ncbi:MAG: hypothetical protein E6Q76_14520, partial [Rhizobium sp.]
MTSLSAIPVNDPPKPVIAIGDSIAAKTTALVLAELLKVGAITVRQEPMVRLEIEDKGIANIPQVLKQFGVSEEIAIDAYCAVKKYTRFVPSTFKAADLVRHDKDYLLTSDGTLYVTNPFANRRNQAIVEACGTRAVRNFGCVSVADLAVATATAESAINVSGLEGSDASRQLDKIIDEAIEVGASDIHIQPQNDEIRVLFRRDGKVVPHTRITHDQYSAFSNTILSRAACETGRVLKDINGQFSHI